MKEIWKESSNVNKPLKTHLYRLLHYLELEQFNR